MRPASGMDGSSIIPRLRAEADSDFAGRGNSAIGIGHNKGPADFGIKVGSSLEIPGFSALLAGSRGLYPLSRLPGNAGQGIFQGESHARGLAGAADGHRVRTF